MGNTQNEALNDFPSYWNTHAMAPLKQRLEQCLDQLVQRAQTIVGFRSVKTHRGLRRSSAENFASYQSLEPRKLLATLTVDTASDVVDLNDGLISLREAITAANTNAAFGDAPAGDATGDAIQFDASLADQTITLGGSELEITDDLVIRGGSSNIIISGDDASRIFSIDTDETVVLSRLAIESGRSDEGGALLIQGGGTVRLFESTFTSNAAEGGPSIDANGGAVANKGSRLLVTDSVFENNNALREGGAIYSEGGSINFLNSTLGNNSSFGSGGGLSADGGEYYIVNSTVEQNDAVFLGGGFSFVGADTTALFIASTIDQNVAVSQGGAGSEIGGGGGIHLEDGRLFIFGGTVISANRVNTSFPAVGNGGGILSRGGDVRIGGSEVSSNVAGGFGGGVEISNAMLNITGSDINDNEAEAGGGIAASGVDLVLQGTRLRRNVAGNPRSSPIPISRGGALWITGDATSSILGSSFQFNTAGIFGGAIYNTSDDLTITSTFIGGNTAFGDAFNDSTGGGGGIFNKGDRLTINSSTIQNNRATGLISEGGGIYSGQGILNVNFSSILRNNAEQLGGGIAILGGEATLFETNIGNLDGDGNRAGLAQTQFDDSLLTPHGTGGGIFVGSTAFRVTTFSDILNPVKLTVFGGVIADNVANNLGAGVSSRLADVTFRAAFGTNETMVVGNRALREDGGGLYAFGGILNLVDVVFEENQSRNGAGIFVTEAAALRLAGAEIRLNEARRFGGGLYVDQDAVVSQEDATIESNIATFNPDVFQG